MKKGIILILLYLSVFLSSAQDLIYTISGRYNQEIIPLDSIMIENLSNYSSITFKDLNEQDYYEINLTKKTVGINEMLVMPDFSVIQNMPGTINIRYNGIITGAAILTIYNINSQSIYLEKNLEFQPQYSVRVQLGTPGIFIIKIQSPENISTFKVLGSTTSGDLAIQIADDIHNSVEFSNKSISLNEDFYFMTGDSIRIKVFREEYSAEYTELIIDKSHTINFILFDKFIDDRDGNSYKTIKIGNQEWMAENLAFLPNVFPSSLGSTSNPCYYVYAYQGDDINDARNTNNYQTYGVLYNWEAAMTACPDGWHLPTYGDWNNLEKYLINNGFGHGGSGSDIAKSMAAKYGWNYFSDVDTPGNDPTSNNDCGFTGLAGGFRDVNGIFTYIGYSGNWWSSADYGWYRFLGYHGSSFGLYNYPKLNGFSVRCIRDELST